MKVMWRYEAGRWLSDRLRGLESSAGLAVDVVPEADDKLFARLLGETEVLWHVLKPITKKDLAAAPRLRLIQKIGVGVNTIDLEAAKARGVAVANMPGTNSRAVAEMTLMLMLAALRGAVRLDAATRAGAGWAQGPALQDRQLELGGRSVGLVGYGAAPRLLAPMLRAMGCAVLYTATAPKPDADAEWRPLDKLLAEADIVSLHLPQTAATTGLIDAARLAAMKPGAVLVNTARGGLVDETALVAALQSGRLAAAGLDVFALEPTPADNPLLALPNVVLAPHVAWLTRETLRRSLDAAVENCRRLAAGEALAHQVV